MEKTRCPLRLVVIFKNYFFVWLNFTAESSLEKSRKNIFAIQLTKKKNFVTFIENLPQHLSAIIYQYCLKKLRFIDYWYRPGLF